MMPLWLIQRRSDNDFLDDAANESHRKHELLTDINL